MKLSKLDKKIIYWSIMKHDSQSYETQETAEVILEELQELRGEYFDTFEIIDKIDKLRIEAKIKRGELVRCGIMLIPTNLESWKDYCKTTTIV